MNFDSSYRLPKRPQIPKSRKEGIPPLGKFRSSSMIKTSGAQMSTTISTNESTNL